jgi:hypothetical protein
LGVLAGWYNEKCVKEGSLGILVGDKTKKGKSHDSQTK